MLPAAIPDSRVRRRYRASASRTPKAPASPAGALQFVRILSQRASAALPNGRSLLRFHCKNGNLPSTKGKAAQLGPRVSLLSCIGAAVGNLYYQREGSSLRVGVWKVSSDALPDQPITLT